MGAHTGRNSDQYWRRRATALACALGAVGLLAWACTGAAGDDEPVRNAGAAGSVIPPPTVMPTVTVTTTTTPEPVADGGPCRDDDLVVNISASQSAYTGADRPEFRITVVNMGAGTCMFDTGSLDVRVTSGSDRIWSSAECRRGGPEKLRRGIPHVETITWDRKRGCKGGALARPGTYVADLKGHKVDKQIFHLR